MSDRQSAREQLIGREFPVLDRGHVVLLDVMGDDHDICRAARVSYGKGTRPVSDDRTLIRYLMRHAHSSPFEQAEVKLAVKCPIDVMRQWGRHRTAHWNEYSTRYSEAIDDVMATASDAWRLQSAANKQGSDGTIYEWPPGYSVEWGEVRLGDDSGWIVHEDGSDVAPGEYLSHRERCFHREARQIYEERLAFGVAREQARKDLPLSNYTAMVWKCDLHNLLHFLRLRMDAHAQAEIRAYADVVGNEIVAKLFPIAWEAFVDYALEAVTLSRLDAEAARRILSGEAPEEALSAVFSNGRERSECAEKLRRIGVTP